MGILLLAEFICGIILLVYRSKFVELAGEEIKKQIAYVQSNPKNGTVEEIKKGLNEMQEQVGALLLSDNTRDIFSSPAAVVWDLPTGTWFQPPAVPVERPAAGSPTRL